MIPEIGQFAMILALLLAAVQAFFGIAGPWRGQQRWMPGGVSGGRRAVRDAGAGLRLPGLVASCTTISR